MHFELVDPESVDPELMCPLCQNVWDNPVELDPCGDIFCGACLKIEHIRQLKQHGDEAGSPFQCPKCARKVEQEKPPNRVLVNVVSEIEVRCSECGWKGTRGTAKHHQCSGRQNSEGTSSSSPPTLPSSTARARFPQEPHPPPPASSGAQSSGQPPFQRSKVPGNAPLPMQRPMRRAQDDNTESGLLRNFEEIGDDLDDGNDDDFFDGVGNAATTGDFGFLPPLRNANTPSGMLAHSPAAEHPATGAGTSGFFHNTRSSTTLPSLNSTGNSVSTADAPWRELGLPQVEYDQLMGVFMQFDEEFAGHLTLPQFQVMARYLNFVNSDEDGARLFHDVDVNRNGCVTFNDFCRWRRNNQPHRDALYGMTTFQYTDAILKFRSVDPQILGVIGWDAFRALCLGNGLADSEQRARQLFVYCDERNSGYVSLHQFLKLMQLLNTGGTVPVVGTSTGTAGDTGGIAIPADYRTVGRGSGGVPASTGGAGRMPPRDHGYGSSSNNADAYPAGQGPVQGVPAGISPRPPQPSPAAPTRPAGGGAPAGLPATSTTVGHGRASTDPTTGPAASGGRGRRPIMRLNAAQNSGGGNEGECTIM